MARIPPRAPQPPRRRAGAIRPQYPRPWPMWLNALRWSRGCAICSKARVATVENDHGFCWRHHPDRAAQAIGSPSPARTRLASLPSQPWPDRKTCERILRLAGRTEPKPKPPRPRRVPRDRAYVR